MDNISFFALGGLDENGKNLYVLEINNDIFVIECGLKYPDAGLPGIDIVIPKIDYLIKNKNRVKAILISHGHDDQIGSLPYLCKEINAPIYATQTTIDIIEIYSNRLSFNHKYNFVSILPSSDQVIAGHKFRFFQTSHSIAESFGFAIETTHGNIVYTSDFILNFDNDTHFNFDIDKLIEINKKPTLLLLSESHGADKKGCTAPEHKIDTHLRKVFEEAQGRVFVSIYTQNFYNTAELINIAHDLNKKIVFYSEEYAKSLQVFLEHGSISVPRENLCSSEEIARTREQSLIILLNGSGERLFASMSELANGLGKHRGITLKDTDTFVLACPPVPGTEKVATAAIDLVYQTGAKVVNLTRKEITSMHAHQEDLKFMLKLLKPKYYLPIKGEYRHLMANAKLAISMDKTKYNHKNIFIVDNGIRVNINETGQANYDGNDKNIIIAGDVLVDGVGVGTITDASISARSKMSEEGVIILGVTVDSIQHRLISLPDLQMRGFVFLKDSEKIVKEINGIFKELLDEFTSNFNFTIDNLQSKTSDRIYKYVKKETNKMPMIIPCIVDVNKNNK